MIEARRHQPRRQGAEVAGDHLGALSKAVGLDIGDRHAHQLPLQLDADQPAVRDARGQAEHRGPGAGADIEHLLARLGGHGCCEKYRVDGNAIALLRLKKPDLAAEQRILAQILIIHLVSSASNYRPLSFASASRSRALARS